MDIDPSSHAASSLLNGLPHAMEDDDDAAEEDPMEEDDPNGMAPLPKNYTADEALQLLRQGHEILARRAAEKRIEAIRVRDQALLDGADEATKQEAASPILCKADWDRLDKEARQALEPANYYIAKLEEIKLRILSFLSDFEVVIPPLGGSFELTIRGPPGSKTPSQTRTIPNEWFTWHQRKSSFVSFFSLVFPQFKHEMRVDAAAATTTQKAVSPHATVVDDRWIQVLKANSLECLEIRRFFEHPDHPGLCYRVTVYWSALTREHRGPLPNPAITFEEPIPASKILSGVIKAKPKQPPLRQQQQAQPQVLKQPQKQSTLNLTKSSHAPPPPLTTTAPSTKPPPPPTSPISTPAQPTSSSSPASSSSLQMQQKLKKQHRDKETKRKEKYERALEEKRRMRAQQKQEQQQLFEALERIAQTPSTPNSARNQHPDWEAVLFPALDAALALSSDEPIMMKKKTSTIAPVKDETGEGGGNLGVAYRHWLKHHVDRTHQLPWLSPLRQQHLVDQLQAKTYEKAIVQHQEPKPTCALTGRPLAGEAIRIIFKPYAEGSPPVQRFIHVQKGTLVDLTFLAFHIFSNLTRFMAEQQQQQQQKQNPSSIQAECRKRFKASILTFLQWFEPPPDQQQQQPKKKQA